MRSACGRGAVAAPTARPPPATTADWPERTLRTVTVGARDDNLFKLSSEWGCVSPARQQHMRYTQLTIYITDTTANVVGTDGCERLLLYTSLRCIARRWCGQSRFLFHVFYIRVILRYANYISLNPTAIQADCAA